MTKPTPRKTDNPGRPPASPRFIAFLAALMIGVAAHQAVWPANGWARSMAVGFDFAAVVFLASLVPLLPERQAAGIRGRAETNSANAPVVLAITSLLTVVVMSALIGELPAARGGEPLAIARMVGTLLAIWLFANTVYALHYAHAYYTPHPERAADGTWRDCGGLDFPNTPEPTYLDFAYFSFTLGMTFQTSDVAVTDRRLRAVALLHSFAAFLFNIGVIAFTINALGGGK